MNTLATSEDAVTSTTSPISPELVSLAKQAFYDFGERPVWTERAVYGHRKPVSTRLRLILILLL